MQIRGILHFVTVFWTMNLVLFGSVILARSSEYLVQADRPETIYDPLFGIEYHLRDVQFERAPNAIYTCSDLSTPSRELFLFGEAVKGKIHFYYVYGLVEVDWGGKTEDVKHFEAESDDGIIVVMSPNECRFIGAGYALSPDKQNRQEAAKYGITDDVISALLVDAVDREVKAFGGAKEFLRRIAASGIDESKLPSQVRVKLAAIRKKIRSKSPSRK